MAASRVAHAGLVGQQVVELLGSTTVDLHDFLDRLAVLAAQLDEELPSEAFGLAVHPSICSVTVRSSSIDDVGQLGEEPGPLVRCAP